jgi:hypothetical protein
MPVVGGIDCPLLTRDKFLEIGQLAKVFGATLLADTEIKRYRGLCE